MYLFTAVMNVPITSISTLIVSIILMKKSRSATAGNGAPTGAKGSVTNDKEVTTPPKNSQLSKREMKVTVGLSVLCVVFVLTTIGLELQSLLFISPMFHI